MPAQPARTAKKTAAARKTTPIRRDTPAPVAVNFDTWHRPEPVDPFVIVIGGKRYESLDPMDVDYRELSGAIEGDPDLMFQILFPDDAAEILTNKIPIGALADFNEAASTHFGLQDFIAAQG